MSEEGRNILETVSAALPKMSDFNKGYILGVAEAAAQERKNTEQNS